MYAFNHRFSPTVYFGMTVPTMIAGAGGLVLGVLAIGAMVQARLVFISLFLTVLAVLLISWSIYYHVQLKTARIRNAIFIGRIDKTRKSLELIRNT